MCSCVLVIVLERKLHFIERGRGLASVFVRDYMEYIQEIAVVRPGLLASWSME